MQANKIKQNVFIKIDFVHFSILFQNLTEDVGLSKAIERLAQLEYRVRKPHFCFSLISALLCVASSFTVLCRLLKCNRQQKHNKFILTALFYKRHAIPSIACFLH